MQEVIGKTKKVVDGEDNNEFQMYSPESAESRFEFPLEYTGCLMLVNVDMPDNVKFVVELKRGKKIFKVNLTPDQQRVNCYIVVNAAD